MKINKTKVTKTTLSTDGGQTIVEKKLTKVEDKSAKNTEVKTSHCGYNIIEKE